ncbi:MAG TPA: methyltransferase domain-containing protein [Rhodothermales bacterium]
MRAGALELIYVNRYLGGYASIRKALGSFLRRRLPGPVHILDLGAGVSDVGAHLVEWGDRHGVDVRVMAVEGNPALVREGARWLDDRLPERIRHRVQQVTADVWNLSASEARCDVAIAALFLHHLNSEQGIELLRRMSTFARDGIVVSDLHRHGLAYHGIRLAGWAFRASPVFRHDGPISVQRGFKRAELAGMAEEAGLTHTRIRWNWAFRWTLSTVE